MEPEYPEPDHIQSEDPPMSTPKSQAPEAQAPEFQESPALSHLLFLLFAIILPVTPLVLLPLILHSVLGVEQARLIGFVIAAFFMGYAILSWLLTWIVYKNPRKHGAWLGLVAGTIALCMIPIALATALLVAPIAAGKERLLKSSAEPPAAAPLKSQIHICRNHNTSYKLVQNSLATNPSQKPHHIS